MPDERVVAGRQRALFVKDNLVQWESCHELVRCARTGQRNFSLPTHGIELVNESMEPERHRLRQRELDQQIRRPDRARAVLIVIALGVPLRETRFWTPLNVA